MNEIDPKLMKTLNKGITQSETGPRKKSTDGKTREFARILDNSVNQESDKTNKAATPGLPEIKSTFRAQRLAQNSDTAEFSKKIESSLQMLEHYAAVLSNPQNSLNEAKSLLNELVEQTSRLKHEFLSLNQNVPELNALMSHLDLLVKNETVKFDRGDYL